MMVSEEICAHEPCNTKLIKINMDITGVIKSLDTGSWREIRELSYRFTVNVCKTLS